MKDKEIIENTTKELMAKIEAIRVDIGASP